MTYYKMIHAKINFDLDDLDLPIYCVLSLKMI